TDVKKELTTEERQVPKDLIPFIYVMKGNPDESPVVVVVEPEELERAKVRKNGGKYLVGHITVDSGQLIIVDPCYLRGWKPGEAWNWNDGNHYAESCPLSTSGGELNIPGVTVKDEKLGEIKTSGG